MVRRVYSRDECRRVRGVRLCAVLHRWRVPEKTLLLIALLGGSPGAYAGMKIFRHKTRHRKFSAGIPVILAVQCAVLLAVYLRVI